ncbi:MAG: hypothetical protein WBW32_20515 [Luteibacter sp.]
MLSIMRIVVMLVALGFAAVAGASAEYAGKCNMTFPEQRVSGRLAAGGSVVLREWSSRCTGLFTASAGSGRPMLQEHVGGRWLTVQQGISIHVPQLGPGSYRLVVVNVTTAPAMYNVRFRLSGG